jgi:hypothetical protein
MREEGSMSSRSSRSAAIERLDALGCPRLVRRDRGYSTPLQPRVSIERCGREVVATYLGGRERICARCERQALRRGELSPEERDA